MVSAGYHWSRLTRALGTRKTLTKASLNIEDIAHGIPPGSILGLLLFLVSINGIANPYNKSRSVDDFASYVSTQMNAFPGLPPPPPPPKKMQPLEYTDT